MSIEDYFHTSHQTGLRVKPRVYILLFIKFINDGRMREVERAEGNRRKLNSGEGSSSSSSNRGEDLQLSSQMLTSMSLDVSKQEDEANSEKSRARN